MLSDAHTNLAAALGPLGIEIGPEVLSIWLDRRKAGRDPLPAGALRALEELARQLLAERTG